MALTLFLISNSWKLAALFLQTDFPPVSAQLVEISSLILCDGIIFFSLAISNLSSHLYPTSTKQKQKWQPETPLASAILPNPSFDISKVSALPNRTIPLNANYSLPRVLLSQSIGQSVFPGLYSNGGVYVTGWTAGWWLGCLCRKSSVHLWERNRVWPL